MSVLDRLAGLETEYAIRFRPNQRTDRPSSKFRLYQQLLGTLRRRIPAVEAKHFKEGAFLATGGAVWYETERLAPDRGLIEGSTPECRGPRQLMAYQRAQDRLLSEAAKTAPVDGVFRLIKNDRDSHGNVYGAQENYEARLAAGWRLGCWRAGLVLLLPAAVLAWLSFPLIVAFLFCYLLLAGALYLPLHLLLRRPRRVAVALFGEDLVEGRPTGCPMPSWLEAVVRWLTNLLTGPLAGGLCLLSWLFAFRDTRRQLLPFLLSRPVISGAGLVDDEGRLQLSDKAPSVNCTLGMGGLVGDRPIFVMGHLFKAYCVESCFSWRELFELGSPQQRLQIGLGDSNMCELAEYLRVGATMLVLDTIEAGEMPPTPKILAPIRSLHAICRDPSLTAEVTSRDGRRYTALELQRFYLDACRRFLERRPEAPDEAFDVLVRWEGALEMLVEYKQVESLPEGLVGGLDWATKQFLLDRSGELSWSERKKIDIRYHELSGDGYFEVLRGAQLTTAILSNDEIERAMRSAPPDSPATTRGHYIREFAQTGTAISANWKSVILGPGVRPKVIRLRNYGRRRPTARPRPPVHLDGHQRNDAGRK